ncbi:MAG: N-acetylmuramidase domain-containing protein [Dehalococcoidia bacterium]
MTKTTDPTPSPAGRSRFLLHDAAPGGVAAVALAPDAALEERAGTGGRGAVLARLWNRYGGLVAVLAERTALDPAVAIAVVSVESGGQPFGPDGRLLVRFEPHVFRRYLGTARRREFDACFRLTGRVPWEGHAFRRTPADPWHPFHGAQRTEWAALEVARAIDDDLALRSTSMGLAQVMGFNHARVGYRAPRAMFEAFAADVRFQLVALFDFIRGEGAPSPALEALHREDYVAFARAYNGPGQASYYGALIEADVAAFRALQAPGRPRTYVVVAGDTLTRIARRFGVPAAAIVRANTLANPDLIHSGQRLVIPSS